MKIRPRLTAALAVGVLGAVSGTMALSGTAMAGDRGRSGGQSIDTNADLTPFKRFTPLASSSTCPGEVGTRAAKPFVVPTGYEQQVVPRRAIPERARTPTTGT